MKTKLDGCINRYSHQIQGLGAFSNVIRDALEKPENARALAVFRESCIILVVTYLEEYLKCLVSVAAINYENVIRDFLLASGNDEEKKAAASHETRRIYRFAERRVSFEKGAKRLEKIFDVLFGFSPWPDETSGKLIRDLVRVRNVIVHCGGWPEEEHFNQMETPDVIAPTNTYFYKLNLDSFLPSSMYAVIQQAKYIQEKLEGDQRYKL